MDAVDRFDIVLDISDREVLYDYVECEEYHRPASGTWDLSVFKGKGTLDCVHEDDENGQFRVDLMDRAIADKRCFEKKSEGHETSADDFKRELYECDGADGLRLPKRVIPFYRAGEVVRGKVELVLNKPIQAERLVVSLQGRAFVKIRIYHAKGYYDVTEDEKFVREKVALWQNVDDKVEDTSMTDQFSLLTTQASVPRGTELSVGSHSYPFEFALPAHAPQSTPSVVISTHNRGYLMYRIKAGINKDKALARGNIVTHKGLWLKKTVDIAENPKNLEAVSVEEVLQTGVVTFWKSGHITVRAKVPKKGFLIGESVPLTVEIYNESKGTINSISACVRMHGKARTGESKVSCSQTINIKSTKVTEGPVAAGMCPVYNMVIPWDFSESSADGNLLPVGDLNDCKLLDINYEVRIKLNRKGLHRNLELTIPIVVGNKNSVAECT